MMFAQGNLNQSADLARTPLSASIEEIDGRMGNLADQLEMILTRFHRSKAEPPAGAPTAVPSGIHEVLDQAFGKLSRAELAISNLTNLI